MTCTDSTGWRGLYRKDYDLQVAESMAHPAKAAWGLAFKIIEHLEELGLLNPGDRVLDPMMGTGRFCLAACAKGYSAVGLELESRFIGFCQDNLVYASQKLGRQLDWTILQGDARKLSGLLKERGLRVVMSPPYADAINSDAGGIDWEKAGRPDRLSENNPAPSVQGTQELRYSHNPENIGNLPDRPLKCVTSPPYEDSRICKTGDMTQESSGIRIIDRKYGNSEGQVGQEKTENYLEAMRQVYAEIGKVANVLCVTTKNPTRAGKLRRLDLDTIALLEATGWTIRCHHKAILFEEQETTDLFGDSYKKPRGRLSFFKRLSYARGSPVASHEDVVICVKEKEL